MGGAQLDELRRWTRRQQNDGKRIVMTTGCSDLLHVGHLRMLQQASQLGQSLLVCLNTDKSVARLKGGARPVVPMVERKELLEALPMVTRVHPFDHEEELLGIIKHGQPDVLVHGPTARDIDEWTGAAAIRHQGGVAVQLANLADVSTTAVLARLTERCKACTLRPKEGVSMQPVTP